MSPRICLVPRVSGVGGMVSFQHKLSAGLAARGVDVCYDLDERPYDAVLVIGGMRQLSKLRRVKRRGVPVVQRLDGINWIHRKRRISWRHTLRAESGNIVLSTIRRYLANQIVYQSEFSRIWWEDWYKPTRVAYSVIHNGVDLGLYSPDGPGQRPPDRYRLLVVEGSLGGGYDMGLESAVKLAELLSGQHGFPMELMLVGKVSQAQQAEWSSHSRVPIIWSGQVPHESIPQIDRSAHILFSGDLHPACPNSVIEALACGLPVVAFNTGALSELVPASAGRVVPYGGDPWNLDPPDMISLADAAAEILHDLPKFQAGARAHAASALGLDNMVDRYLEVLLPGG